MNIQIDRHWDATASGSLERAIAIAVAGHAGQTDKAGAPYILHPLRVMARVHSDVEKIVAVLHDLVEDVPGWSFDKLRDEGFGDDVVDAVACLSKLPEEERDYSAFIRRVSENALAKVVKLADLEDNLDVTRLPEVTDKDQRRLTKYIAARNFLLNGAM